METEFSESEYSERDVKRMVAVLQKEYNEILSRKTKRDIIGEWKRYSHSRSRSSSQSVAVARDLPPKTESDRESERQRSFSKSTETRRSSPSKEPSIERPATWGDTTPSRTPSKCRLKSSPKWSVDIKRELIHSRSRSREIAMKRERSSSGSMSLKEKRAISPKRERTRSRTRSPTPLRDRNFRRPKQRRSRSGSRPKRVWGQPYKPRQPRSPYKPKQQRSRSRNRARKPQTYMEGDWDCSCGQHNFARRVICFRCEAPHNTSVDMRELPGRRPSPNNRPNPRWRGQPYVPGDWKCPSCGLNNFARRSKCFECYATRSSRSSPKRETSRSPSVSTSATPPPEALMTYKKRRVRSRSSTWEREKSRRVQSKRRKDLRRPQHSGGRNKNFTNNMQDRPLPKRVPRGGGSPTRPGALERPTNFRDRVTRLARAITGNRVRKAPAEELATNGTKKL